MTQRFVQRFDELRGTLQGIDPGRLADDTGALFEPKGGDQGIFTLNLWGRPVSVSYPGFQIAPGNEPGNAGPASPFETALILYYFATADGAAIEGRWIAFSELPDGRFYDPAFQGYTGKELARSFGDDQAAFERAAGALGGRRLALGDAAFAFQALPRLPVAAVYWRGDEDFPSACQMLFDASASHYLPTDACAVLGSTLTRMLIKNHLE